MSLVTITKRREILAGNSMFKSLSQQDLEELAKIARYQRYAPGDIVCSQGDQGDDMFMMVEGNAQVSVILSNGDEVVIRQIESGDGFGEIALFDSKHQRTASVRTISDCEILLIQREAFIGFLSKYPHVAINLLEVFSTRMRDTNELMKDSLLDSIGTRLANVLENLAQAYGRNTSKGLKIDENFSDGILAQIAGVPEDVVTAHLKDWCHRGYIKISRGLIIILQPEELAKIRGGRIAPLLHSHH